MSSLVRMLAYRLPRRTPRDLQGHFPMRQATPPCTGCSDIFPFAAVRPAVYATSVSFSSRSSFRSPETAAVDATVRHPHCVRERRWRWPAVSDHIRARLRSLAGHPVRHLMTTHDASDSPGLSTCRVVLKITHNMLGGHIVLRTRPRTATSGSRRRPRRPRRARPHSRRSPRRCTSRRRSRTSSTSRARTPAGPDGRR